MKMQMILRSLCVLFLCGLATPVHSVMNLSGSFVLSDSSAFMDIEVKESGVLHGIRAAFLKLTNKGATHLDSCMMTKEVFSYGELDAKATSFLKDLTVCSGKVVLDGCHVTDLYIMDHDVIESPIEVVLRGAAIIQGSIFFETGEGKVYKGPDVVVLGDVLGGVLDDL